MAQPMASPELKILAPTLQIFYTVLLFLFTDRFVVVTYQTPLFSNILELTFYILTFVVTEENIEIHLSYDKPRLLIFFHFLFVSLFLCCFFLLFFIPQYSIKNIFIER